MASSNHVNTPRGAVQGLTFYWNTGTLTWVPGTQPGGSGGGGDGAILDGVAAGIKATVFDYVNANPLAVVLRDTNGDYVSVGGGTQYAEDSPAAANEIITMAGVIRNDTRGTLVNFDADRTELQVNSMGDLRVDGSAVTQPVSNTVLSIVGGGTEATAQRVTIANNSTGLLHVDDNSGSLTVDGTVAVSNAFALEATQLTGNTSLASVKTNTDPLVAAGAGGYIRQDSTTTIALETGGNLATLAGTVTAARAAVNPISGQVGVQGASGVVTALTQRVVLATDVALPTGSNAIGKLSANDGIDIGDVTVNNAAGASAVNVQDGGNSLTVDAPVATPVAARLSDGGVFYDAAKTGQLPAALVGGRLDDNIGSWLGSTAPTVGSKTSANSVPVVVASDQGAIAVTGTFFQTTQPVSINQTGTNNDVDILTIAAGDTTIGRVKLTDGTTLATVRDLAANDALNVAIVDAAGNQITTFGGGAQYTEDSVAADGSTGTAILPVRQDLPTIDTSASGDFSFAKTDAYGRLWVNSDSLAVLLQTQNDLLTQLLAETRVSNYMWQTIYNTDDLDIYRNDPSITQVN